MVAGLKTSLFWSFMEQGGASVIGMIVQIILARILAPEAFGIMAILLVFTSIMASIAQSGLGSSLIQRSKVDDDSYSTAFWLSGCIALFLYILLFFGAPIVASFYQMSDMTLYLRVLGLTIFFNAFNSIQRSYLQRSLDFKALFKANFLGLLLSGIIGVVCALLGFGVWALVVQSLTQGICACITLLYFVPWKPKLVFRKDEARGLFQFGWKICATGIINVLYDGTAELVIGKACNATQLGYYSQGRKYPLQVVGVLTNAISNVIFPTFSKMKEDMVSLRLLLKNVLSVGTFVIAPISILFCVIAEPLIAVLLTEKWLPSVPIFQLIFFANAFLMFQIANLRVYTSLGDSGLYLKLNVLKALFGCTLICGAAVITQDIYIVAAVASFACIVEILLIDMHPARRVHGYGAFQQLKDQMPTYGITFCSAALAFACSFLPLNYILVMIVQIIVFGSSYLGMSRIGNRYVWGLCVEALGLKKK